MTLNYVDIAKVIINESTINEYPRYFSKREIFSFIDIDDQKRKYCSSWFNKYFAKLLANKKAKYYSISHSGKYVIFAASNNCIGIDIQANAKINYSLIAARIFNNDEFNNKISQKEFYRLWCCKEALIKTLDKSAKYRIKDLKICKNNNAYYSYFKNYKYYFKVGILNKHIFAICSIKKITSINRAKINVE